MELSNTDGLSHLGSQKTEYKSTYAPEVLETFANKYPGSRYVVELECPEFTALCPKTAQPDFANIIIRYSPNAKLVESKSLKLYLFSFRNTGSFHEDCVNKIAHDLFDLMQPHWIEVRGDFFPRGGISINPIVRLEN
jgi:7-cyano-7-deazaguanine reductase